MATPTTTGMFNPEVWSAAIIDEFKKHMDEVLRPKRSVAVQQLRDAALGHPEYPEPTPMTATEVRMRNEQYNHQLDAMAYTISSPLFNRKGAGSKS